MSPKFLCDIIPIVSEEGTSYDPAVMEYWMSFQALATTYDATAPGAWMLLEIIGGDIALLQGDPRIDPLPNVANTTPVASINSEEMATLRAALTRRGIGAAIVDTATTFGDILAGIALRANAGNVTPAAAQLER